MAEKVYIELDEIVDAINHRRDSAAASKDLKTMHELNCLLEVIQDRDCIPSADVAPVKHGHWIYDKDAECVYCSSCLQFNANEYTNKFSIRSKFCSRCGARMDEEEQGFDT